MLLTVAEVCGRNAVATILPEMRLATGDGVPFPKVNENAELWLTGTTDYGFFLQPRAPRAQSGNSGDKRPRKLIYLEIQLCVTDFQAVLNERNRDFPALIKLAGERASFFLVEAKRQALSDEMLSLSLPEATGQALIASKSLKCVQLFVMRRVCLIHLPHN